MRKGSGFARRVTLQNVEAFAALLQPTSRGDVQVQGDEDIDLDRANTGAADAALAAAEALFVGNPLEVRTRHRRRSVAQPERRAPAGERVIERGGVSDRPTLDLPVLVAEIPRAASRWNQANFDLATYEGFFGAKIGVQRIIQLQHVGSDGALGSLERTPSVEVKSRNFRLELQAARGVSYPTDGRPITVFVKQPSGVFLYRLVMPNERDHASLVNFLNDNWRGRRNRMRRIPSTIEELRRYWPDSPLWQALSRA